MKKNLLFAFLFFSTIFIYAQNDSVSLWDMSLEELMNLQVNIASNNKSYNLREAPAVVSVISEQEIRNMGARDLIDVLKIIPGFDFGTDVNGIVSLIYRGMWVQEGKALLMIDGQVVNELMYSCNHFGLDIPMENVLKIEILRGPGSATYGDCAEMVVINIITKSGSDLNNAEFGGSISNASPANIFRKSAYGMFGKKINNFEFSTFAGYATSPRGSFDYTDQNGYSYNISQNTITSTNVNLKVEYKNISFIGIYDNYKLMERDHFGTTLSRPYGNNFNTMLFELSYTGQLNDKWKIISFVNFKRDVPWHHEETPDAADTGIFNNLYYIATRTKARILATYNYNNLSFAVGVESSYDFSNDFYYLQWNNKSTISYYTFSGILQANYNTKFANIIAETRFDKHNLYGGVFAPRFALTKEFGRFNYKILWNRAFRAPSFDDFNLNISLYPNSSTPPIKPEISTVYNIQFGITISKMLYFEIGAFQSQINNPIIYIYNSNGEGYDNYKKTGSNGIETELITKFKKGYVRLNYSFYTAENIFNGKPLNEVPDYFVVYNNDTLNNILLGAPQHKVSVNMYYDFTKKINANLNFVYTSFKYGYSYNKTDSSFEIQKIKPNFNINFALNFRSLLIKNLDFSLCGYNLLNQQNVYAQPYNGGHSPIPGTGREILLNISYKF